MGNSLGHTIGTKCVGGEILVVSDSHSPDEEGKCLADGKTVIMIEGLPCLILFNMSETLICFGFLLLCRVVIRSVFEFFHEP